MADADRHALAEALRQIDWTHDAGITACHYPGNDGACDNQQHYFADRAEVERVLAQYETPAWAPGIDILTSVNAALHAVDSCWQIDLRDGQAIAVPTPEVHSDLMSARPQGDETPMNDTQARRIYELETENARLQRKIATGPQRDWIETDDPEVAACMGSAPECAASGCQYQKLNVDFAALRAQLAEARLDLQERHQAATEAALDARNNGEMLEVADRALRQCRKALHALVAMTEQCDNPADEGVGRNDPVMVTARAVLAALPADDHHDPTNADNGIVAGPLTEKTNVP